MLLGHGDVDWDCVALGILIVRVVVSSCLARSWVRLLAEAVLLASASVVLKVTVVES